MPDMISDVPQSSGTSSMANLVRLVLQSGLWPLKRSIKSQILGRLQVSLNSVQSLGLGKPDSVVD